MVVRDGVCVARRWSAAEAPWVERRNLVLYVVLKADVERLARLSMVDGRRGLDAIDGGRLVVVFGVYLESRWKPERERGGERG